MDLFCNDILNLIFQRPNLFVIGKGLCVCKIWCEYLSNETFWKLFHDNNIADSSSFSENRLKRENWRQKVLKTVGIWRLKAKCWDLRFMKEAITKSLAGRYAILLSHILDEYKDTYNYSQATIAKKLDCPLHYCADNNEAELAKVLLHYGFSSLCSLNYFTASFGQRILNPKEILLQKPDRYDYRSHPYIRNVSIQLAIALMGEEEVYSNPRFLLLFMRGKEFISYLNEFKGDLNDSIGDEYNSSIFHIACRDGLNEIIAILISKGVDINKLDDNERRPLSMALRSSPDKGYNLETIHLLLNTGMISKLIDN
jgi:hypothetical protein